MRRYLPLLCTVTGMALFAFATWWSMQTRYDQYRPFNQDFADHLQSFWQQLHYGTAYTSITREHTLHHHFFLVFYPLMGLFYLADEQPSVLLAAQAVAVSLSVLPLWAIARHRLGPWGATLLALAYCCFPPLQFGTTFVFYSLPFGLLPFFAALYFFLVRRCFSLAGICLVMALACHEAFFYAGFVLGICLLMLRNYRRAGATVVLGCAIALFLLMSYFFPHFQTNPYYSGGREITRKFYGYLQGPETNMVAQVGAMVQQALQPISATYAGKLLLPLLLLPLASPRFAVGVLLTAGPYLVSQFSFTREIYSYYALLLLPMLFLALIDGVAQVRQRLRWRGQRVPAVVLAGLVAGACSVATVWESPWFLWRRPFLYYPGIYTNARQSALAAAAARVPDEASLLTMPSLAEHLFCRRDLQVIFKENLLRFDTDYIFIDLRDYNWIVDVETPYAPLLFAALRAAIADGTYRVIFHAQGALLLQRMIVPQPPALPLSGALAAEFDRAFAQAFAAVGVPDTAWRQPLFWNLAGVPTVEPLMVDGKVALPVAVGGFAAADAGFDHLRITAGRQHEVLLADLPTPGIILPRIDPALLPEGEHQVNLIGEWRGETRIATCPVRIDRSPPEVVVRLANGKLLVHAADAAGVIEASLEDAGGRRLLTPPLIREWLGEELGFWYHPFPGGVSELRLLLDVVARPRRIIVTDRAGNCTVQMLPAGPPTASPPINRQ